MIFKGKWVSSSNVVLLCGIAFKTLWNDEVGACPRPLSTSAHFCFQPALQGTVLHDLRLPHKDSIPTSVHVCALKGHSWCSRNPEILGVNTPGVNSQPVWNGSRHICAPVSLPSSGWCQEPPSCFSAAPVHSTHSTCLLHRAAASALHPNIEGQFPFLNSIPSITTQMNSTHPHPWLYSCFGEGSWRPGPGPTSTGSCNGAIWISFGWWCHCQQASSLTRKTQNPWNPSLGVLGK